MKAVFSNRAYTAVLAETTEKIKTETGGLFLGTIKDDVWYIIEAIDPGPKSVFEVAYFEYDQVYTQHLINKIAKLYEEKLMLIGLWHRHPGSLDRFSDTDDGTNTKYAKLNEQGAISALVNIDPEFRLTIYHVGRPCHYTKIPYEVGDHLVPDEFLRYKSSEQFEKMMQPDSFGQVVQNKPQYKKNYTLASFMKLILPALSGELCENVKKESYVQMDMIQEEMMDEIMDDVAFLADNLGIEVSLRMTKEYLIVQQKIQDQIAELSFMAAQDCEEIVFFYHDQCYIYHKGLLKKSYKKVKETREKAKKEKHSIYIGAQPGNVFDSVMKIIKYKRNED